MVRLAAILGMAFAACAPPSTSVDAVYDLDRIPHTPLAARAGELHVLLFLTPDCPIANAYAPTIHGLRAEFATAPVRFFLIHVDERLDSPGARQHAQAYRLDGPILLDPAHDLVRAVGATITPEVAVVGAQGVVYYRGRIDNWFGDLGKKRPQPTRHDLRDALRALIAGETVAEPRTTPVGCAIE